MIRTFNCLQTETLWRTGRGRGFLQQIERAALRKLQALDAAESLDDLREPPSNRLERLERDRSGQWSIRVNDQYRVCFHWEHGADGVEIVDYH